MRTSGNKNQIRSVGRKKKHKKEKSVNREKQRNQQTKKNK
jgi:hypothetical protein